MVKNKSQVECSNQSQIGLVNGKKSVFEVDSECSTIMFREILSDKSSSGRERPWQLKKCNNMILEKYYRDISSLYADELDDLEESEYFSKRAVRLHNCCTHLVFNSHEDGSLKLKQMMACKVRLCPLCTWRRSMKLHYQSRKVFEYLEQEYSGEYDVLMLTLTVVNCYGGDLSKTIDLLMKSWNNLLKRNELKQFRGWYRGLEVTHDNNEFITEKLFRKKRNYYLKRGLKVGDKNPTFDTYHPHLHILLVAPKSYLQQQKSERGYITKEKWLKMWQEVTCDSRITQIDISQIRARKKVSNPDDVKLSNSGLVNAVCETTKYTVKEGDYIAPWDWSLSVRTVMVLDKALYKRRLVAWGGILKDIHKKLNLDDVVDGDLLNVGEDDEISVDSDIEVNAFWNFGYQQYFVGDWQFLNIE